MLGNRRGPRPKPPRARLLGHADLTAPYGCWLWTASRHNSGYGAFRDTARRRTIMAHRASWELHAGPIPAGMMVLHTCEDQYAPGDITYRRCINPAHLYLGTALENNRDSARSGRRPKTNPRGGQKGEAHHSSRLTDALVREARMWRRAGATYAALAEAYGVDPETVRDAVTHRTWKHLP